MYVAVSDVAVALVGAVELELDAAVVGSGLATNVSTRRVHAESSAVAAAMSEIG